VRGSRREHAPGEDRLRPPGSIPPCCSIAPLASHPPVSTDDAESPSHVRARACGNGRSRNARGQAPRATEGAKVDRADKDSCRCDVVFAPRSSPIWRRARSSLQALLVASEPGLIAYGPPDSISTARSLPKPHARQARPQVEAPATAGPHLRESTAGGRPSREGAPAPPGCREWGRMTLHVRASPQTVANETFELRSQHRGPFHL